MRLRFAMLACALVASASAAVPAVAGAAPHHNRGLTIHALPHNIYAGDPVLIFGRLEGPGNANQLIWLYHRIGNQPFFSIIGHTRTNASGQYEFLRPDGIVYTNRAWFVRGPLGTHSRTVRERVNALISIAPSSASGLTRHPLVFSGHVTPDHVGQKVLLQAQNQNGSGNSWHTLTSGRLGAGSNYQISYAWRVPGAREVRVVLPGDPRNIASTSDAVPIVIQQTEVADFTIQTSDPIVTNSTPVTISGVLYQPGTTTPEPSTTVALWAKLPNGGPMRELTTTTTGTDGSYQFLNVVSTTNELYEVRTVSAPARHTAVLFEGMQDVVSMSASSLTSTVDGQVTFTGTVSPDKAGHVIYLQKLGADNNWHVVATRFVSNASTFQFAWTFGAAGTKEFRARITGGPANVGSASSPVTIVVSQPPLGQLPTS